MVRSLSISSINADKFFDMFEGLGFEPTLSSQLEDSYNFLWVNADKQVCVVLFDDGIILLTRLSKDFKTEVIDYSFDDFIRFMVWLNDN